MGSVEKTVFLDDEGIEHETVKSAARQSARLRIAKLFAEGIGMNEIEARELADIVIINRTAINDIMIALYAEEQRA